MYSEQLRVDFQRLCEEQINQNCSIVCEDCGDKGADLDKPVEPSDLLNKGWGVIRIPGTNHKYLVCSSCKRKNLEYIKSRRELAKHAG